MTNKFQCISYLILISIFIDQGDGRWKDREKEELRRDFMAYRKIKEKLQKSIEAFVDHHPRDFLLTKKNGPYLKDFELDFLKQALVKPKNDFEKLKMNLTKDNLFLSEKLHKDIEALYEHHPRGFLFKHKNGPSLKDFELDLLKQALVKPTNDFDKLKMNVTKNTQDDHNRYVFKPINEKMDEVLNKSSKSAIHFEHSSLYPSWPKFEDLLRTVGKKYDWKNDRWIKLNKKDQLYSVKEDENPAHYYVKHEFRYKVLKANRTNKKRKNVVVVTAVR